MCISICLVLSGLSVNAPYIMYNTHKSCSKHIVFFYCRVTYASSFYYFPVNAVGIAATIAMPALFRLCAFDVFSHFNY